MLPQEQLNVAPLVLGVHLCALLDTVSSSWMCLWWQALCLGLCWPQRLPWPPGVGEGLGSGPVGC